MSDQLKTVGHNMQKVRERTTALEGRVSLIEDDLNPLKREMRTIKMAIRQRLKTWRTECEKKKARIVGLPERSEGSDPTAFLEEWFKDLFGAQSFSPFKH